MESRNMNTCQKIRTAFLDLYEEMPIQEISITALTTLAQINRGTFYLHYSDLDELLMSIEDEQLEVIDKLMNKQIDYFFSNSTDDLAYFFIPISSYVMEHKKLFKILLGSHHSHSRFSLNLQEMMRQYINKRVNSYKYKNSIKKDYLIKYVIAGSMGILIDCLNTDINISHEELAELFGYTLRQAGF